MNKGQNEGQNLIEFLNLKVAKIILERVELLKNDIIAENDYTILSSEITELLKVIETVLPEENLHLINDLEELYNKQQALSDEFMYAKGVIDGSALKNA